MSRQDTTRDAAAASVADSSNPNKKPRLLSDDDNTRNDQKKRCKNAEFSLPDLVLDIIMSHCTSVEMVRLCRTSKAWGPSAERVASAIVQAERDQIYWGLLLYRPRRPDDAAENCTYRFNCFEYGDSPKLRRLYELETSTKESYHFPTYEEAARFLRSGLGRSTIAELHCPSKSIMMHDSMGGLVQGVGGLTKDKLKFVQTKKTLRASVEKQYRFIVKIIYRDGPIGGRDNVFLGVINEKYEPAYRSRDASKHNKSVKNGRFIRLPRARRDHGVHDVVVGVTLDMERKEFLLDYGRNRNSNSSVTLESFAPLRGKEFRLAFRQERYDPQVDRFYGVLDIAMREVDREDYEKLMNEERATERVKAAAALATVKRTALVRLMKRIVSTSSEAGIADTQVHGMPIGRTIALKEWYAKPADLDTLKPINLVEKYPKFCLSDVIEKCEMRYKGWHFTNRICRNPDRMKLYSRYLLEKLGKECVEIGDHEIIKQAFDIVQKIYDIESMRSKYLDVKSAVESNIQQDDEESEEDMDDILKLQRRLNAFECIAEWMKSETAGEEAVEKYAETKNA
mmetsp:Transcript_18822/g.41007  ORF Transcript_18822/g.41007 Transcript_18822/m.41007 type:complete len:567 (+) Transcript_18822:152-1852(+)